MRMPPPQRRRHERLLRASDEIVTWYVTVICKGCEEKVLLAEMAGDASGEVIRDLKADCPRHGPLRIDFSPLGRRSKGSFRRARFGDNPLYPSMKVTVRGYP